MMGSSATTLRRALGVVAIAALAMSVVEVSFAVPVHAIVVPSPVPDSPLNTIYRADTTGRFVMVDGSGGPLLTQTRIDRLTGQRHDVPLWQSISDDLRWILTAFTSTAPIRWTSVETGEVRPLPTPPPGFTDFSPRRLSSDGSLVLGTVFHPPSFFDTMPTRALIGFPDGSSQLAPIEPSVPVAISPSNRYVLLEQYCLYTPVGPHGTYCHRWFRWDRVTGQTVRIVDDDRAHPFAISDDGSWLERRFPNGDARLGAGVFDVVRTDTDRATVPIVSAPGPAAMVAISSDASAVALLEGDGRVTVVDTATGQRRTSSESINPTGALPVLSGDGSVALFVRAGVGYDWSLADVVTVTTPNHTGTARLRGGEVLPVAITGVQGVPLNATAVALNVTVTNPARAGFATVWPCDQPRPDASNVNFVAGRTVANAVVAQIAPTGSICLASNVDVDVVVDVQGWFTGSAYTGTTPDRFLDTRNGETDSVANTEAGEVVRVPIAGRNAVPANATAVATNVTVTNPAAAGFATVWPCGQPRPDASNVNFLAGQTVANAVIAQIGSGGAICSAANTSVDLVVDVQGWFTGAAYTGLTPDRLLDTRNGEIDSVGNVGAGTTTRLPVVGQRAVPTDATAVVLNVTATNPGAAGFVTVWPCDQPRPLASNVNFLAGQTVPNAVIAQVAAVGPDAGSVCLAANTDIDLVIDVQGAFRSAVYTGSAPVRFLDTRD